MSDAEMLALLGNVPENADALPDLVRQFGKRAGILPFVGAGMSAPFRYPQWGAFLIQLAEEAGKTASTKDHLEASRYEEAASDLEQALGPRRFQDLLAKNFGDHVLDGLQIKGAVRELTRLPQGPVITTNFDRLLETAFARAGQSLTPYTSREANRGSEALQQDKPFLLKLHGDWDRPDGRVLTLPEYESAYGAHDADGIDFKLPLPTLLFQLLSSRCCLFLGCSLQQDRTVRILRAIARGNPHLVHYAIIERPASDEAFRRRAFELSNQGIRPVWFPTGAFDRIEPLLGYLADRAVEGLRKLVHDLGGAKNGRQVPNNIPELNNATFGREHEIHQLQAMLHAARVVTIIGAGGCGKSRVAVEVAARSLADYEDGIWFVSLADLAKSADKEGVLAPRVGRVLGAPEQAGRPPHESLAEYIGEDRLLLVLDNCEHLVKSCRDLVAYLLSKCTNLTILATSRRPLDRRSAQPDARLMQERLYPLAPLQRPEEGEDTVEALSRNESVQLFIERARERSPNWQLTPAHTKAVAELCRALDGIPLAIEVAAARFPARSVEAMMAASQPLIETIGNIGSGDLRRWKTLTAALKWSYGLLGPRVQQFMRVMTVFDGGWSEEAARAVYSRSTGDDTPVIEHIEELLNNSLLVSQEVNGLQRFRFLEPIRQAVEAQVKPEERAVLGRAHADYFMEIAEIAAPELLKAQQKEWLDKLVADVDNFRAAFRWCVANVQPEHGLRLTAALWRFAEIRGYLTEGRMRAREVLAIPGAHEAPALLAKALSGAGMLAYRQGDFEEARLMFQRCLSIETDLGNDAGRANALNDLGNVANLQGDLTLARKRYGECLEIEQRRGNARAIAVAKFNLGWAASGIGDYPEAERLMTESVQEFRAGGNDRESAFPLNGLAQVAIATGRIGLGEDFAQSSLEIRERIGDTKGKADALRTLGWAAMETGNFDLARTRFIESIQLARGVGDKRGIAETLELFGVLYARLGRHSRSVEALGAADQVRHGFNYALPPLRAQRRDSALSEARAALGELEYERAWKRGVSLSLSDSVDRAAKADAMDARQ